MLVAKIVLRVNFLKCEVRIYGYEPLFLILSFFDLDLLLRWGGRSDACPCASMSF